MAGSPNVGLDGGAVGEWCARAFAGALVVAGRLPLGPGREYGEYTERALALRMGALVQQVPPYRALRGLQAVVADGWADGVARRYASHSQLVLPLRGKAADLRPTACGWVDIASGHLTTGLGGPLADAPEPGSMEEVLSALFDRIRRYFAAHATVGVIGEIGAEAGLARLRLLLSRFEAGVVPERGATVEQIHQGVPDLEVRELVGLVGKLRGVLDDVLDHSCTPLGVAEPVFVRDWAQGDLMMGGTLVAVSLGDQEEVARRLRHVIAHAWLDVDDLYRVREVGVYLAVAGTLVTWSVADLAAQLLLGADPDAARAEFRALTRREITVPRPVVRTAVTVHATVDDLPRTPVTKSAWATLKGPTVYGPERWNTVADAEWTYWDLWFSILCVVDHGGDWDDLDAKLYADSRDKEFAERMWSHLVDLKGRLTSGGITAADIAGDLVGNREMLAKARSKVVKRKGIRNKDLSPAMRNTPSARYTVRAHFGSWHLYPVSPGPFYWELAAATPFNLEGPGRGLPTFDNIDPLFEALDELETEHANDPPRLLAVRRAGLTASSLAHHRCNDSYGDLGMHTSDATLRFTLVDWRATGIDPIVFWRDVLEIFILLDNFGVTYKHEAKLIANLGANRDRLLLKRLVDELHASYIADRLDYPAREIKRFWNLV